MCGRYSLAISIEKLIEYFDVEHLSELKPHYNIAPSQPILVVRMNNHQKAFAFMRWGFIPAWLKEENISSQWINARAETLTEKPMFRHAFKHKRCLIPADGFFEWQVKNKYKQPYYIRKKNREPFAMAGIWERWESKEGRVIESCAIITTEANQELQPIHHRMPVVLEPEQFNLWLNPDNVETDKLQSLLTPSTANKLDIYAVGSYVNKPTHDTEECIKLVGS